jgi:hypothetical protein
MADASYHFLSFVRTGFAASITRPDTFGGGQPALATAPVGLTVSGVAEPVTHAAVVRGPGDVIGLAASQVVRTDPVDGAVGVEPNYFAQVEFDRPDLPWLFAPAAHVGERLRPWIVLVVVDLDGPHPCSLRSGSPLPRLEVPAEGADQLPDLASSYLWAHAQVVTPGGQTVTAALDGDPRLAISRLMCPRHLEPFRSYLAAVVPAFEVGRLAGLGHAVTAEDESRLDPAYQPGGETVLPVLYSFRFKTGEQSDFESLARKLEGRPLPAGVGTRPLDVSRPGAGLPSLPPPADVKDRRSIEWLDGALRPLDSDALPQRDPAAKAAFQGSLTVLLDRPAELVRGGGADPVVAPPIYGDKHALVVELGAGTPPPWIAELNLDARTRIAAGLGTQVVQARQEDLVARAWQQLGDVLEANRMLRAAQLARSGSLRLHERLMSLEPATLLAVAAPAHDRVAGIAGAQVTAAKAVRDSRLPDVAVEAAFRRITRPAAVTARTAAHAGLAEAIVGRFAGEAFRAPVAGPDGVSAMRPATEVIGGQQATAVLAALGDEEPGTEGRLDEVLGTLGRHDRALPTGDEIRAATPRTDVGGVALMTGLGAVPAGALSAVLDAATAAAPPPPPRPPRPPLPVRPPRPPLHEPPVLLSHLPRGLGAPLAVRELGGVAGLGTVTRVGGLGAIVFKPPGSDKVLGGDVILRDGAVVIESNQVAQIVNGSLNVRRIDDNRWAVLAQESAVPPVKAEADPIAGAGNRLDVFRRDPVTVAALAQLASGRVEAALALDGVAAAMATTGAASKSLKELRTGTFRVALPEIDPAVAGPGDLAAAQDLASAASAAFDRVVGASDAPPPPAGPVFDLAAARTGLLAKIDPETTLAARIRLRLESRAILGVAPRDELDPVMACPQFLDPMWQALRDLDQGWLLPGLELVLPDTATIVRTNPGFVTAHMVGLNHELMRELLWREYPTDQRGTGFRRFWGRSGEHPDDIRPVHEFAEQLVDNLLTGGAGEAVLLLRSELLRRYPGSIVYLSRATQQGEELALDEATIVLPTFRGDLPPDVTFVGFPITPDALRIPGEPWWFVIAQPPSEPRFGLDEGSDDTADVPTTANELAWSHLLTGGQTRAPFAIADPPLLREQRIDGMLTWGASAAVQAHLTYQRPVRVAIRAADMLPPEPPPT